ncbi:MAG TPA: Pre-mRNA processing ribonucleoprotein, partial [Candidatus Nanoarchaeia archaeon]|nr:Pre-mRNA processing ribonucleoprotein [Candidatus Nanoarchaeia archaeon]
MDIQKLRQEAIVQVRAQLRNSVSDDLLIIQTISNMEDLDKASNLLSRRLREWYELYNPETSNAIT